MKVNLILVPQRSNPADHINLGTQDVELWDSFDIPFGAVTKKAQVEFIQNLEDVPEGLLPQAIAYFK